MTIWLQCIWCGQDCIESTADGLFGEDDEGVCPDCGTINYVTVDDQSEPATADITTADVVKDVGQNRCDGTECGSVAEFHGTPCRWDCKRANMPEKEKS